MKPRITYVENKATGSKRIGLVGFSKTGGSVYYGGRTLQRTTQGIEGNHFDVETHEEFWVSGCKRKGGDTLSGGTVEIDEDVRDRHWAEVRNQPCNTSARTVE